MATVIAITGGIACGKSYCTRELAKRLDKAGSFFDCDETVSNLLTDDNIVRKLRECVGSDILDEQGALDRSILREVVFEDSKARKKVENLLHPLVLELATSYLKRRENVSFSLVEVPLLYEAGFPLARDIELVIGCSRETQLKRLREFRQISPQQGLQILDAQWPVQQKIDRSDHVIWNDGSMDSFDDQIQRFSEFITSN
jgi:dephospho-CoA kinase